MNGTIRVLKGTLAMLALAGLGLLLRWMTAGSIGGLRTYDLDSLTVLAVGTIAWIAYGWLVLAVVLTVLEQIPGAVGTLAGAVAGRITTKTARALLRSGLGVAAVTPLTVGAAHAAPTDTAHVRQWAQPSSTTDHRATEPRSTVQFGGTSHRATEPRSTVEFGDTSYRSTEPRSTVQYGGASFRSTEPASSVELGGSDATPQQAAGDRTNFRATEPASTVEIGGPTPQQRTTVDRTTVDRTTEPRSTVEFGDTSYRSTEPRSTVQYGGASFRSTEPASSVELGGSDATPQQAAGDRTNFRATEPASTVEIGGPAPQQRTTNDRTTNDRPTEPRSAVDLSTNTPAPGRPAPERTELTERTERTERTQRTDATERPVRVAVPDRPTAGAPTRYTDLRPEVPVRIVVREGDSLWSIAARELGPAATPQAIAARWPDWYAANRHVIGDDPDLILPGQVLRIPPAPTGDHLPPHHQEQ